MSVLIPVSRISRTAGFSAFSEADFTSFYKFIITVLQVPSDIYKEI